MSVDVESGRHAVITIWVTKCRAAVPVPLMVNRLDHCDRNIAIELWVPIQILPLPVVLECISVAGIVFGVELTQVVLQPAAQPSSAISRTTGAECQCMAVGIVTPLASNFTVVQLLAASRLLGKVRRHIVATC